MIVVDASVWVSGFVTTDSNHPASQSWLEEISKRGILTFGPSFVLLEAGGAVARLRQDPSLGNMIIGLIEQFDGFAAVEMDDPLVRDAIELATSRFLRGADAMYVALAQRLGSSLVSWDREQLQRAAGIVQVYTPASYPFPPATT